MNIGSLVYQFLVGGVIFAVGLTIPWLAGDYSWKRREDRLTTICVVLGFIIYLVLQTLWHLSALGVV